MRRTVYWSPENGTVVPVDQWLGLTEQRFSPGVRERCCREALHGPFEVASANLQRTAQLSLDGRTLREIVENQGWAVEAAQQSGALRQVKVKILRAWRAVEAAQQSGALRPAFTAADCKDQTLIGGADGVMVPLVTQQQKDRRRETEAAQRLAQGRASTAPVGRPKKGSEGPFQECKLVAFYDPDKTHCHVVGTAGDYAVAGRLLRREARRLHLAQAKVQ